MLSTEYHYAEYHGSAEKDSQGKTLQLTSVYFTEGKKVL